MLVSVVLVILMSCSSTCEENHMESPMKHSDVVFMYPADPEIYKVYRATWVAWGGASPDKVREAQDMGIHYAASTWALTAGAENLHKRSDLRDAVCKDILLEPIVVPWLWDHTYEGTPSYFGCTNNPTFRKFTRDRVISAVKTGADGLHIDDHLGSAGSFWHGGCFCDFCVRGFREFLKAQEYRNELEKNKIEIDDFNYRDFLRERVSTREEYKKRRGELPLTELYWLYQVKSAAAFVSELRKLAEDVKGSTVTCSANTFMPNPVHLVVTTNLTHCVCETEFRPGDKNPPDASPVAAFKLMDAVGKPMAATASGWNWAYAHAHNNAVGLVRLWIAESYALGHRLMVPHRKWAFTQEKGTHWYQSKPEDFAYLYQFIRENADLFDGYEPYSQIALVFCNKSVRHYGIGRFQEACKQLADANLLFSVVIAGDNWVEDRLTIDALKRFDTVVVPEPAELSGVQKEVLQKWENVKGRKVNRIASANDVEAINSGSSPVRVTGPPNIWVLPRLRPDSSLVCHILNRNYDSEKDSVVPARDVAVLLGAPLIAGGDTCSCKLISPGKDTIQLDAELRGDRLYVPIPELGVWSLLIVE
jgi:hypothetical protein